MQVNLFFNYYKSKDRQHEIDECLRMNTIVFDNVITYSERLTFYEMFNLSKKYPNDINVFCNSDIYFTDANILRTIRPNECYALTRWNKTADGIKFFDRVDSQDAWVFKGVVKDMPVNFTPGLWGCDNRLVYELQRAGYKVSNPSLSIKTVHLHEVDSRNQVRTEINTVPPPYKTLIPCHL
jgi:hypothetical protein